MSTTISRARPSATFFHALPPYLGGKRRLCPLIFSALGEALPRERWRDSTLLDPFAGGGAVSLYAKAQGFRVVASDISERSCIVTRALVANSSCRLTQPQVLGLFRESEGDCPRRAAELVPAVFTTEQARWLDSAFAQAHGYPEPTRSMLQLLVLRTALSLQPMSTLNATDSRAFGEGDYDRISPRRLGHYGRAWRRLTVAAVWKLAQRINAGVFGGRGEARRGGALEAIAESTADVLYLDPPYPGTTGYDHEYAALDQLLGDEPPERPPPRLDELLDVSERIPWLVLSYGGPTVTLAELEQQVGQHRPVRRAIEIPYLHLASLNTKERSGEFLIVAGHN